MQGYSSGNRPAQADSRPAQAGPIADIANGEIPQPWHANYMPEDKRYAPLKGSVVRTVCPNLESCKEVIQHGRCKDWHPPDEWWAMKRQYDKAVENRRSLAANEWNPTNPDGKASTE